MIFLSRSPRDQVLGYQVYQAPQHIHLYVRGHDHRVHYLPQRGILEHRHLPSGSDTSCSGCSVYPSGNLILLQVRLIHHFCYHKLSWPLLAHFHIWIFLSPSPRLVVPTSLEQPRPAFCEIHVDSP